MDVQQGRIASDQWSIVASYVRTATRYCVSPLTIGEIIWALAGGDAKYFGSHQQRLRVLLSPNSRPEVFDFVPYFTAHQLGIEFPRPAHLEDDFLGTIDLILEAPSKDALLEGFQREGAHVGQTARVRIDRFAREHAETLSNYEAFMEARRNANPGPLNQVQWASGVAGFYGIPPESVDLPSLAAGLSAAYEHEMFANRLLNNPSFSVSRNRSDLIDGQQLIYLCDPQVVFISNDSDFRNRITNSPQLASIQTFSEVFRRASNGLPLL